jgi:hypothetical protein
LLTAKLEEAVTEEIQEKYMYMLIKTVFQKKLVKHTSPKIQISSAAQTSKNVKIVLLLPELSQEIKEIVGLKLNIQSGKLLNTVKLQVLIK